MKRYLQKTCNQLSSKWEFQYRYQSHFGGLIKLWLGTKHVSTEVSNLILLVIGLGLGNIVHI